VSHEKKCTTKEEIEFAKGFSYGNIRRVIGH